MPKILGIGIRAKEDSLSLDVSISVILEPLAYIYPAVLRSVVLIEDKIEEILIKDKPPAQKMSDYFLKLNFSYFGPKH